MLNIYVLEDEMLQQSRMETIIYKVLKDENLKLISLRFWKAISIISRDN